MHIWPVILRLAAPAVWLRRRLRPHKIFLYRVEGTVNGGEQPLSLICSALNQNKYYFLEQAFAGTPRETSLGQVRLMDAFRIGRKAEQESSLVVLETNPAMYSWLDDGGWFFIPAWVSGEVELPVKQEYMRHDSVKTTLRKIIKHGFEYEVTQDEERFKDFYHNMHVPYVTKIFGNQANLDSYAEKRGQSEIFDLVLIRKRSQPDLFLGGFLIIYEPAAPRLWSVGVRDGNMDHVQQGVLAALYIFSLDYLAKKGFSRVNMGSSRPFLQDGVLKFKKKFSMAIVNSQWRGYAMKVLSLTPATKTFLLNNPFIFRANERLHGAIFTEAVLSPETVAQLHHQFFYPGLARLVIYSFNEAEPFTVACLPPELAARIEIRSAKEVASGRLHLP